MQGVNQIEKHSDKWEAEESYYFINLTDKK